MYSTSVATASTKRVVPPNLGHRSDASFGDGGGRGRATLTRLNRGEEGRRGCPGGRRAHPRRGCVLGLSRGARGRWQSCSVGGGRRRRRIGRRGRFPAGRFNSMHEEVKGGEAEHVSLLDLFGVARSDGGTMVASGGRTGAR